MRSTPLRRSQSPCRIKPHGDALPDVTLTDPGDRSGGPITGVTCVEARTRRCRERLFRRNLLVLAAVDLTIVKRPTRRHRQTTPTVRFRAGRLYAHEPQIHQRFSRSISVLTACVLLATRSPPPPHDSFIQPLHATVEYRRCRDVERSQWRLPENSYHAGLVGASCRRHVDEPDRFQCGRIAPTSSSRFDPSHQNLTLSAGNVRIR